MRWATLWKVVLTLVAHCRPFTAQGVTPTVCEEEACQCDSFTRVICNCTKEYDNITLRPDGAFRVPSSTTAIIIDGCTQISFLSETISNLIQLRNIELKNVQSVYIHERSLAWSPFSRENEMNPGIKLYIQNSTINEISSHAVQGRFDDIIIANSRIKVIKPFAFSSLYGVKNIELKKNTFENIEIQAFKKFTTVNFVLRGGTITTLPSRFLSNVEVTNLFRMDGVHVKNVLSLTYLVKSPKRVIVENSFIDVLEGDAFHISSRGPITFRNNTVRSLKNGAFYGLSVDMESASVLGLQELLIDNNTITELTPSSLIYNKTTLSLRVDGLNLNATCACEIGDAWRTLLKEQGGSISCWYALEGHYVSVPTYMDSRCGAFKQNFWIFIVIGVVFVLIVAAIVTFLLVRRENEKKKKLQMVMPDGKTYRETEFHIVIEQADLLTTDL